MRSRSSRLFVVLLHLVGVSNNLPNHPFQRTVGIVGVHPLSILLEPLELQAAGGLSELLSLLERAGYDVDKTLLNEPYWLQDDTDGTCLGPSGFSECGDATLWKIRRRPVIFPERRQTRHERAKMEVQDQPHARGLGLLAFFHWDKETQDQNKDHFTVSEWEYALELADVNFIGHLENSTHVQASSECIISVPLKNDKSHGKLIIGSCESNDAWSWKIDEGGELTWERNRISIREEQRNAFGLGMFMGGAMTRLLDVISDEEIGISHMDQEDDASLCLWKTQDLTAVTSSCDTSQESSADIGSLVSFSVIQYQNSAAVSPQLPRFPRHRESTGGGFGKEEDRGEKASHDSLDNAAIHTSPSSIHSPPITKRPRQKNAVMHESLRGMKNSSRRMNIGRTSSTATSLRKEGAPLHTELHNEIVSPIGIDGYYEKRILSNNKKNVEAGRTKLLHHPPLHPSTTAHDDGPHRTRKIPVHPYIAASKNGYYKDEVTGLEFPTDISEYLGHNRKETGRHTLTGLGVYTRTMLKIKVYGVGFYVSKRDVLADPTFSNFAGMTVDELRSSDKFYSHLMSMRSNSGEGGYFDRTLFIKLNMQLATETVRQSLTGEWKLLTDEHKNMLSASSAKEREADERMLRTIQSEENTSNCSCGQSAPPEYKADPTCCARGTEMVFTWRKNGDMELRIDGRVMDIFPHPEIGKGIFFEYLRGDDPMSMDARNHFADGFPFLLAPLAQFRDYVSRHDSTIPPSEKIEKRSDKDIIKMFSNVLGEMNSQAHGMIEWLQLNVSGGISNLNGAFYSLNTAAGHFGETMQNMASDIDSRRGILWKQFLGSQRWLFSKIPFVNSNLLPLESHGILNDEGEGDVESNQTGRNIFLPQIARMLGESVNQRPLSDEIGVIIEPTMNLTHMMFLYLVHFYLLLLLIISVPDSSTTRLVVKRSSDSTLDSDTDNEERCKQFDRSTSESSEYDCDVWSEVRFVVEKNGVEQNSVDLLCSSEHDDIIYDTNLRPMKKALSYFV